MNELLPVIIIITSAATGDAVHFATRQFFCVQTNKSSLFRDGAVSHISHKVTATNRVKEIKLCLFFCLFLQLYYFIMTQCNQNYFQNDK